MTAILTGTACSVPTKKNPAGRTGTAAGYIAHLKASESACPPCRQAQAAKTAVRRGADAEGYAVYRKALRDYEASVLSGEAIPVCAKPTPEQPAGRTGTSQGYYAHDYALGNFRDDPNVLLGALTYLLSHGKGVAR